MRRTPKLIQLRRKDGSLKSPYWQIYYFDGARDRTAATRCRVGSEDDEAQIYFHTWCLERERPTAREPEQLLIAQALKDYWEEHAQFIATSKHAKYHEKRLNGFFAEKSIRFVSHITPSVISQYTRECEGRKESNGTIRRDLEHLKAAFNHEVAEKRLTHAPKIKLPEPPEPRSAIISEEEKDRLLAACKEDHLKNFVILMLNTGQRPGAIEKLKWFQVDFKECEIHFQKASKYKNKKARTVVMNDAVYDLLTKLYQEKKTEFVLERYFSKKKISKPAGCVKKSFAAACKRAGLSGVGRYTLRHTTLDRLNDVADEKTSSDIGGHSNTRTTRRNYIKSKKTKQRDALNNLWGNSTEKLQKAKKGKGRNATKLL